MRSKVPLVLVSAVLILLSARRATADKGKKEPIVPQLTSSPTLNASTVPGNGDVNPYGVAFVPHGFPKSDKAHPGDILVSNFNNSANAQGTGTTIVAISPTGQQTLFFQGPSTPGELGLTTALGVLRHGFVLVGSVPTLSGNVVPPGELLILDRDGGVVKPLSDAKLLDGPWDLTISEEGEHAAVFVSNVLSGTVTRLDLKISENDRGVRVEGLTQIASGYLIRPDPSALVVGPTGLAYDRDKDILYVASTGDNAIFAISKARRRGTDAGMGTLIYQDDAHLRGPLGLVLAPNGDLITTNGDAVNPDSTQPSEIVEFTNSGEFVAETPINSSGMQGGAFGIALSRIDGETLFAAVDDIFNTLKVWNVQ
jgi:hypothetical protein